MILDTNALSAFVDGDAGVGDVLRTQARAAIPGVVLGEFRYRIAPSKRRVSYEAWLDANLIHFDILPVTDETAVAYAALRVTLKRSGRPTGARVPPGYLTKRYPRPTTVSTWLRAGPSLSRSRRIWASMLRVSTSLS